MDNHYIVNIGRQLASGGRQIGKELARRLNLKYFDKELIRLASEESGLCSEFFEKADEKAQQGVFANMLTMRFPFVSDSFSPHANCLSNDALFQVQSDVIRKLAAEHSCLFVGRCADYILREHPRCVNVFISADHEDRVRRLVERLSVTADTILEKEDKKRSEYYNYYSNKVWGGAASYHLCINSSALGFDKTIDYIEDFVLTKLNLK